MPQYFAVEEEAEDVGLSSPTVKSPYTLWRMPNILLLVHAFLIVIYMIVGIHFLKLHRGNTLRVGGPEGKHDS
jgi:hypothetical protein